MNTDRKPAELVLVNGTEQITLRPMFPGGADPIICKSYDLGAPEYRYTTVANPGADGTTYSDGFVGARTVTFELAIMGGESRDDSLTHDAYWYASRLVSMTHPMAKPVLHITRNDEASSHMTPTRVPDPADPGTAYTQTMQLRGSPYNLPYTSRSAALLEMQLVFTCPLGLIEGPRLAYSTVDVADDGMDWVFPAAFPKKFGLTRSQYPHLVIPVGGDTPVAPILYINGPCTDPEVMSGDDQFRFRGLTLAAGQTVQVDMGTGNVRLGASGTILDDMTVYNTVDWSVSTFWRWPPGDHEIYYLNTSGTLTVEFKERRITA